MSFVTGHPDANREPDWRALGAPGNTAVFYMGLARMEHIAAKLIEHGASPARPAALIAQGTTADQRVITASLATIREAAAKAGSLAPAVLVVGEVAALHDTLAWFNPGDAQDAMQSAQPSAQA